MAKTKQELLDEAQKAGKLPDDVDADEFTARQLEGIIGVDQVAWEGSFSSDKPQVAPDGHVNLSQEDLDARV